MRAENKDIKKQSEFCFMLAEKLNRDIQKENDDYLVNPSQHRTDAKRLRRELLELSKMLELEWDYSHYK